MPRLRRSDCSLPGIRRRRAGKGFTYVDECGRRVTDKETLDRIRALAIPPAWTDVWICSDPWGHIQALGTDSKGRRQYRYHDAWRVRRDDQKFEHTVEFARVLPQLRRKVVEDLAADQLTKERVLAAVVALAVSSPVAMSKTGCKRAITRAMSEVAGYLGNTPAVARSSYVDPRIIDRPHSTRSRASAACVRTVRSKTPCSSCSTARARTRPRVAALPSRDAVQATGADATTTTPVSSRLNRCPSSNSSSVPLSG